MVIRPEGLLYLSLNGMVFHPPPLPAEDCVEGGSERQCGRNPGAHQQLR